MVQVALLLVGVVVGSFLGVLTYRIPRRMNFVWGRSRCPNCKREIKWYDNIPILSFLFLRGKCRYCKKNISSRYPLLEIVTGVCFILIGPNIFNLFLACIFISIFVIDVERMLIPDELVLAGILVAILNLKSEIFVGTLAGLLAADFLLFLNLITKGKGMGLGDVKLAILIGMIVGLNKTPIWLFYSFVTGAIVGLTLIAFGKANMKQKIAFGPFLIIGMVITQAAAF